MDFLPCCCAKTLTNRYVGRKGSISLILVGNSKPLKKLRAATQGKNLGVGTKAETWRDMEKHC